MYEYMHIYTYIKVGREILPPPYFMKILPKLPTNPFFSNFVTHFFIFFVLY